MNTSTAKSLRRDTLLVAGGACCISAVPVFVKWISLGPASVGFYRMLLATLALSALALGQRGRPLVERSEAARAKEVWGSKAVLLAIVAGALFGADLFVWHQSIRISGAGIATLLANTHVFWVALLSALFLGERLGARFVLAVLLAAVGIALATLPGLKGNPLHPTGVALGLLTGLFYGSYYLALRGSRSLPGALATVPNLALANAVSTLVLFFGVMLLGEPLALPAARDGLLLLILGLGLHTGGWLLISSGMAGIGASRGALLLLLQPALATVWGVLLFHEALGWTGASGVALTLLGVYGAVRARIPTEEIYGARSK